jgi:DNA mismatch repair ATPase MutL
MTGRFPVAVLNVTLPPQLCDVNVHPAKTEVKFANERAVFDAIRFGVLSALNKNPGRPEMQLGKKTESPAEKPAARVEPRPPVQTVFKAAPAQKQETFRTMNVQEYKAFAEAGESCKFPSNASSVTSPQQLSYEVFTTSISAIFSPKWATRSGMSSRRSRRGGMGIWTTLRR